MTGIAKRIKYAPFKESVAQIVKQVQPNYITVQDIGRFFLEKHPYTGKYTIYKVVHHYGYAAAPLHSERVYDPEVGVLINEPVYREHRHALVWLLPQHTQNNIQELRDLLSNFSKNDASVVLEIKECLDTLGWEYTVGMDCDTADAFFIYRDDDAPADAVGKYKPLGLLSPPELLKETLSYLQEVIKQKNQPSN